MTRVRVVVAIFAFVALATPAASVLAQAPAPKVTITGLFDQITSMGRNFYDGDYTRTADHEWYARTRFRPDFVFEVGKVKAVLGLEIDLTYGAVRPVSGGPGKGGTPGDTACVSAANCTGDKRAVTSDLSLNTDTAGVIEIKWIYTEFPLTGKDSLLPFFAVETMARAGGQPFASLAQMREYAMYAGGDFAGLSAVTQWAPSLKTSLAYVIVEDELANYNKGTPIAATNPNFANVKLTRGNDWAVIASPEINVFKGLDFKPMYSFFHAEGTTSAAARRAAVDRFVAGNNTAGAAAYAGSPASAYTNGSPSYHEDRNTFGFEAIWRSGAFGFAPALYYQFGGRDVLCNCNQNGAGFVTRKIRTDMASWLFDAVASYQTGSFLLEVRPIYSTGNKAHDNLARSIRFFEPLDEDGSYYTGWAMILAGGPIDYFNGYSASAAGMKSNVGYDRFGRAQVGIRGTYSWTPALSFYGIVSPTWAAEEVDTDTGVAATTGGNGIGNRVIVNDHSFTKGDSRYIGTEFDLGLTWRFSPNTAFALGGGYLFAGNALKTSEILNGVTTKRDQHDAYTLAARVRFAF